jgi:hypothetical protein
VPESQEGERETEGRERERVGEEGDPVGGLATGLGERCRRALRLQPHASDATGGHFSATSGSPK